MCGIAGIYKFKGTTPVDPEAIVKMRDSLFHRGPDDNGIYFSPDKRLCFAHTRLSIIDLTALAHQPMSNNESTVWIVYNGEIYNYRQLQSELKREGYSFKSNSDTEAIIYGYEKWGIEGLLRRLRGMFAFAIYDIRSQITKLILARDRFGIKPLYYYQDTKQLIFSSEVRAILKSGLVELERNKKANIAFLIFGNIPAPFTTIKEIFSLPVGNYMLIEGENKKFVRYYDIINSFMLPNVNNPTHIHDSIFTILHDTLNLHLISDVPIGVFLSGGIDSSVLVALASTPITTVSIVFDEDKYSEKMYQEMISRRYNTDHRQIKITDTDFYEEIENIFEAMDQPTIDGVNTYFVSKVAKQAGLKVLLSGLGADEVFCGYKGFKRINLLKFLQNLPKFFKSLFSLAENLNHRWSKISYLSENDSLSLYLAIRGLFIPTEVGRILNISEREVKAVIDDFRPTTYNLQPTTLHPTDWLSYMEINFYLQNQLLKDTDFMSMYHSVETRVPYLDHILVDYIASINSALKIDKKTPKPLLVKSINDMLPDKVIFRKKQGFTFPFDSWIKKRGRELLEVAVSRGNLNKKYARGLWREFELGRLHWSRIWGLIVMGRQ